RGSTGHSIRAGTASNVRPAVVRGRQRFASCRTSRSHQRSKRSWTWPEPGVCWRPWQRCRCGRGRVATPLIRRKPWEGDMADTKSKEQRARRAELSDSLQGLAQKRDHTYRLNSDALALDRAGVTHHASEEMTRLGEDELGADTA